MQTRAIIEAAINVNKKGMNVTPEIMIPLVCDVKELKFVKDIIVRTADAVIKEAGVDLKYMVGTMIEIPRAALLADEIAKEAEFFSFGTNDLTQMTYGLSRDDAGRILEDYYQAKIFEFDRQQRGKVRRGQADEDSCRRRQGNKARRKLGICGEHGGDPSSVEFCHEIDLDCISCSPFRVRSRACCCTGTGEGAEGK